MWALLGIDVALVTVVWIVSATVEEVLLERGILGVLVLVLGTFAWKTIQVQGKRLDASEERERALQMETYTKTIPIMDRVSAMVESRTALDKQLLECVQANTEVLTDVRRQLEAR